MGKLDARALEAATIDIPLPDGRIITVVQQHVSRDERQQRLTWTGRIAGSPGGHVLLTRRNLTIAGFLAHGQQRYELQPGRAGRHIIFEVSEQRVTPADAVCVPAAAIAAGQPQPGDSVVGRLSAAVNPVVQDLLVVHTAASETLRGRAHLESVIISAVESANASYRESDVGVTLNLVGLQRAEIVECDCMPDTLKDLASDLAVAQLRDRLGAASWFWSTRTRTGADTRSSCMPTRRRSRLTRMRW